MKSGRKHEVPVGELEAGRSNSIHDGTVMTLVGSEYPNSTNVERRRAGDDGVVPTTNVSDRPDNSPNGLL